MASEFLQQMGLKRREKEDADQYRSLDREIRKLRKTAKGKCEMIEDLEKRDIQMVHGNVKAVAHKKQNVSGGIEDEDDNQEADDWAKDNKRRQKCLNLSLTLHQKSHGNTESRNIVWRAILKQDKITIRERVLDEQFGYRLGKETRNVILCLRMLIENSTEKHVTLTMKKHSLE